MHFLSCRSKTLPKMTASYTVFSNCNSLFNVHRAQRLYFSPYLSLYPSGFISRFLSLITGQTTTVYQLQRKLKALREAVERKDLHVDMLRRKLALTEDAARASRQLEEERDDIIAKYVSSSIFFVKGNNGIFFKVNVKRQCTYVIATAESPFAVQLRKSRAEEKSNHLVRPELLRC